MEKKQDKKIIAERPLLYSQKGKTQRKEFRICLFQPYPLTREDANYRFGDQDLYVCELSSIGLEESVSYETHASDSVAAIHMAAGGVDFLVKKISKNYNVFWSDGDPYFEKESMGSE